MLQHVVNTWEFWPSYAITLLFAWRIAAGWIAHKWPYEREANGHQKGEADWAAGIWAGLGLVLFWPLVIVGLCVYGILHNWPKDLTTPVEKTAIVERETKARNERYLATIAKTERMELEHGIGTDVVTIEPDIIDADVLDAEYTEVRSWS